MGVSAAKFATLDYLADEAGGFRSGLTAFGSPLGLQSCRLGLGLGEGDLGAGAGQGQEEGAEGKKGA